MSRLTAFQLLTEEDKMTSLLSAIEKAERGEASSSVFVASLDGLSLIPGSPLAYWVSEDIQKLFRSLPAYENSEVGRTARCGLGTLDDFRFLRLTWEISRKHPRWVTYYSGGIFSPFYDQFPLVVKWEADGREIKPFVEQKVGSVSRKVQGEDHYFLRGFVFPRRTKALAPKMMPSEGIFSTGGQAGFAPDDELVVSISILSSRICSYLISLTQGRTGDAAQFEVGLIKRLPWPETRPEDRVALASLARRAWSLKRSVDTGTETSHAFVLPALLHVPGNVLGERADAWVERRCAVDAELTEIQAEIDARCFDLYGISEPDRLTITNGFGGVSDEVGEFAEGAEESDDDADRVGGADVAGLIVELVSWAVGVAFGRFDVFLATGERAAPGEPEPFDPLPVCSPGMLTGADGLPLAVAPTGYPVAFLEDGVMVDDPGDLRDLAAAVRAVFEVVFGARADEIWHEAAELLDPKGHDLQAWLASGFFEHHLKRYSKSRRKAPILWQLGTPSGRYSVWLYAHRLSPDSFFKLQSDVVAPKLADEERRLASVVQAAGESPSSGERKVIAAQELLCEELRALLNEVRVVAPLWNPHLDDGVALTMAPLWRMVPQHKAWQKELKSKWDELIAGRYDWSHIAMHLWPQRVVPKCAADRSLAIAHGLEDVFWVQAEDNKWRPRTALTRPIDEIIRERTTVASQAALHSLLEAPAAASTSRRRTRVGAA